MAICGFLDGEQISSQSNFKLSISSRNNKSLCHPRNLERINGMGR